MHLYHKQIDPVAARRGCRGSSLPLCVSLMSPCSGRAARWAKQVLWKKRRCRNNCRASHRFSMATCPTWDYGIGLRHALTPTVLHALNPLGPITGCWWWPASQSTAAARRPAFRPHSAPLAILCLSASKQCFCFSGVSETEILQNFLQSFWQRSVGTGQRLLEKKNCDCCETTLRRCRVSSTELIGERLGGNQQLSADQSNEGPPSITPGLSPPISSKTM